MSNQMFDQDSFGDEVDSKAQAQLCVDYLSQNEHQFRSDLADEGLNYGEREAKIGKVWDNLVHACERVGYHDSVVEAKKKRYCKCK